MVQLARSQTNPWLQPWRRHRSGDVNPNVDPHAGERLLDRRRDRRFPGARRPVEHHDLTRRRTDVHTTNLTRQRDGSAVIPERWRKGRWPVLIRDDVTVKAALIREVGSLPEVGIVPEPVGVAIDVLAA